MTSAFWADNTNLYLNKELIPNFEDDLILLSKIISPEEIAIAEWKEYYDMDGDSIKLLKFLLDQKSEYINGKIVLNADYRKLIPGNEICNECIESLMELNIY